MERDKTLLTIWIPQLPVSATKPVFSNKNKYPLCSCGMSCIGEDSGKQPRGPGSCYRHTAASPDYRQHHKSMTGCLDVGAAQRPVLTSTRGPLSEPEKVWSKKESILLSHLFYSSSKTHSHLFFFSTVITLSLPCTAWGVAGQKWSLIWICRAFVCVSGRWLFTDGLCGNIRLKQPAPACPSRDKKVRKPPPGELCVCVCVCVNVWREPIHF